MTKPRDIEPRINWHDDNIPAGSGMCAQHSWHALGGDYGNPPAWGCSDANEVIGKVFDSGRYWTPDDWDGPPPRGAWVGWKYGSNGHAALSLGNGLIMTTDPANGEWTDTEPLDYPTRWGFNDSNGDYTVWSDEYHGVRITVEDDEMPTAEEIARAVWDYELQDPDSDGTIRAGQLLKRTYSAAAAAAAEEDA